MQTGNSNAWKFPLLTFPIPGTGIVLEFGRADCGRNGYHCALGIFSVSEAQPLQGINMKTRLCSTIRLVALAVLFAMQARGGALTFSPAQTISGDADVSQVGTKVWAYGLGGASNRTINGTLFIATLAQSPAGLVTPLTATVSNVFGVANAPFNTLSDLPGI